MSSGRNDGWAPHQKSILTPAITPTKAATRIHTLYRLIIARIYHHFALVPGKSGGLNGSTQHFLEVYSQESENLKFLAGVDLNAALLCPDPTGNSRTGQFSSGNIVVRARLCFRSSHVARDSADHRSRLSHPWPP